MELENIDWDDPVEAVYAANLMAADDIIIDYVDKEVCGNCVHWNGICDVLFKEVSPEREACISFDTDS